MSLHTPAPKSLKRNFQRMMMDHHSHGMIAMEQPHYNEFPPGVFYTPPPPPPQHVLFSNPFPVSPYEYSPDDYFPSESTGYYNADRSCSDPFIQEVDSSFSGMESGSSSCNVSVGPATPPSATSPLHHHYTEGRPTKFPAVPITPSPSTPRQKAKRTATACEECRKRKQKCDGEHVCQSCKEQKLECKYREVVPTKKDNSLEKLMSLIDSFGKSMEALNQRLDTMSASVVSIQSRLDSQCASTNTEVHA
ncbi:unnamed protein product [Zymoseptoria tritici ST99CH_3D1]|nr:unnamed protein product [Zymoseptoria tritici ST99CH_3D1]